jgi:hypothetical protein
LPFLQFSAFFRPAFIDLAKIILKIGSVTLQAYKL